MHFLSDLGMIHSNFTVGRVCIIHGFIINHRLVLEFKGFAVLARTLAAVIRGLTKKMQMGEFSKSSMTDLVFTFNS
jgi:hypothetical protein